MLSCAHIHKNETSGSIRVRVDCEGQEVSGFFLERRMEEDYENRRKCRGNARGYYASADLESTVVPKRTPLIQCP